MNQLIITIIIVFLLGSFIKYRNFYNGMFLFNSIWLFMLVIYNFQLSYLLIDLDNKTIWILIIMILSFNIVYILVSITMNIGERRCRYVKNDIKEKYLKSNLIIKLFYIWLFLILIEIVYSGGVPLMWTITGKAKTYFDFGIENVHGFVNALALTINLMACSYYLFIEKKKSMLKIIIGILFTYTLLISRQVIITSLIEIGFLIFYYYKTKGKKIRFKRMFVILNISVIIFGMIGNLRTGLDNFYRVAFIKVPISGVFSGFYWVYMYFSMTLANINYVVTNGFVNVYPVSLLNIFERGSISYSSKDFILNKAFTVSGFFAKYLIWDGLSGVIIITALYGCVAAITFNYFTKKRTLHSLLIYAVAIQTIVMSFFTDMLFYKPSSFQFIFLILIYIIFNKGVFGSSKTK